MARKRQIRRSAIRVDQNADHPLYLFTLTAEELLDVADVWHASRTRRGKLAGYQRPEAKRHVRNITEYLDGEDVLFPNPIILALSKSARFRARGPKTNGHPDGRTGELTIPLPTGKQSKPAWVVDGQQRLLALAKSQRRADLLVPVNAFVADDVQVQRDQFIRVNSSKGLPSGLLTELLPDVDGKLPARLASRRLPSALCDRLNQDTASPFFGLIWRSTMAPDAKKRAVVRDATIVKMLLHSLEQPSGSLFTYRNVATGEADVAAIMRTLFLYWGAVRDTFPEAWGLPPTRSRLMHGAGIQAMGRLMDRVMANVDVRAPRAGATVRRELRRLERHCRWTKGRWPELGLQWNEVQNTPSHVNRLSDLLVRRYVHA